MTKIVEMKISRGRAIVKQCTMFWSKDQWDESGRRTRRAKMASKCINIIRREDRRIGDGDKIRTKKSATSSS